MKYWCCNTKFFDSGRVKTNVYSVEAEQKPEDGMVENRMCDEYRDYFDTYKETVKWAEQAKRA